ncbi:hypothetical protein C5S42_02745 [Candidatus Methanomarinus sp.]|nr:hypothetical protein C5S42_02745 [ANME-2 cluster archaeon]
MDSTGVQPIKREFPGLPCKVREHVMEGLFSFIKKSSVPIPN